MTEPSPADAATNPTFDPLRFKETTTQQWQSVAEAWNRWGPRIEEWLGDATTAMLEMAGVGVGSSVVDVAAGAGGQSMVAAQRVGPTGYVLVTDISSNLLDFASATATSLGLTNVATQLADGEVLDVEAGRFDAAISRVGLIYFPDQQAALAAMRRAVRPGGRIAAVVYSTPDRNPFFSGPVGIIRRRAQLPPPAPGQPGPFSLGAPGVIEATFATAGLTDIDVRTISSPLRLGSAAECTRFERESFGALHQMMAGLSPDDQEATWQEIADLLATYETADGFVGPCEMIVAAGTSPGPG